MTCIFSATRLSESQRKGVTLRQHMVLQSAKDGLSLFSAQLQTPLEPKAPLIAKFSEVQRSGHFGLTSNLAKLRCFEMVGRDWWIRSYMGWIWMASYFKRYQVNWSIHWV